MKILGILVAAGCAGFIPPTVRAQDAARWARQAQHVTIIRDDWGIAHVYGKTDADAVFGMIYAQAEDDFNRVETNYLNSLGRLAEAEGASAIYQDLRQKLFIDPDSLKALYAKSPAWLQQLMTAWADGLNFYLSKHPQVKPRVITRFEPWMALSFTEGSIGGDIERISVRELQAFYGTSIPSQAGGADDDDDPAAEPGGSNGIAIAPSNTLHHHALLWINPHTSFYFRSELQMVSDAGLDVYGAVTWGQIFIYQGFNATAGWMHTSSGVDNIDEFLETVADSGGRRYYRHGTAELPLTARTITVPYRSDSGMAKETFTVYYTQHGPVVRKIGDRWVSISLMQNPINALIQSYSRTKAKDYAAFKKIMDLHSNSSNNTIFADAEGNIAYFHSNYIPRRDTSLDWNEPVDGSNPATDYHGLLSVAETPGLLNPASGWLYNSNNWPWSAAGPSSPKRAEFPRYVETGTEETPRGYHALRVLSNKKDFTPDALIAAAFDSYLPAFERMLPRLLQAYDQAPDSVKAKYAEQIAALRGWDYRWGAASIATSLAVFWGREVTRHVPRAVQTAGKSATDYAVEHATPAELLQALGAACDTLTADYGKWQTPWGDINRFQRINDDIDSRFDDAGPSIPVPFTSAVWGSLASFGARPYTNTRKWYGSSGNSFLAVVEFGDSVRAKAVTAGGESGDPRSPHFNDQAARYATGNLRPVYFYRSQLKGHSEREYHPG
ncbi:MAG TPA: penicillin acylase family protein, partial [Gemmatimonadales bacterium]|nr:penicillin acylase family protein [Gemmatimonadales bacterium]